MKIKGMSPGEYLKSGLFYRGTRLLDPLLTPLYRATISRKVRRLREKEVIRVAFVVPELGVWKTESLFLAMAAHERFLPRVLVCRPHPDPAGADAVAAYCRSKGYAFTDLRQTGQTVGQAFAPDIVFYQKPYDYSLPRSCNFRLLPSALFCFVTYAFHTLRLREVSETPLIRAAWQVYYENDVTLREVEANMARSSANGLATGLPMSDGLLRPKACYPDPWKPTPKPLKRIVWGPHHSIGTADHHGMDYGCFLDYAEWMRDAAVRLADKIQVAFKPHPLLRQNLKVYWTDQQIADYYAWWDRQPNTQLELGAYEGLFMHSDAIIHDSGSFTVEYHYTHRPAMYLVKDGLEKHTEGQTSLGRKAFALHYMGHSTADVEAFIADVVSGRDPKAAEREAFISSYLMPPGSRSASENIIRAILQQQ